MTDTLYVWGFSLTGRLFLSWLLKTLGQTNSLNKKSNYYRLLCFLQKKIKNDIVNRRTYTIRLNERYNSGVPTTHLSCCCCCWPSDSSVSFFCFVSTPQEIRLVCVHISCCFRKQVDKTGESERDTFRKKERVVELCSQTFKVDLNLIYTEKKVN